MCYVDADHAGCRVTRRSHTGILLYVQKVLQATEHNGGIYLRVQVRRYENGNQAD